MPAARIARRKPSEVKDYYNQNKRSFWVPELVHAAHIVKNVQETTSESDALAAIASIKTLLSTGAKFEELADEFSDCPGQGGDLGFFPRGEMVDEFDDVVFVMAPGELSDIFRSPFGFHIVKLYERTAARLRPLNEVRLEIEKCLSEEKSGKRFALTSLTCALGRNPKVQASQFGFRNMKQAFKLFAAAGVPHPCCVPGRRRAEQLQRSRALCGRRIRAARGSDCRNGETRRWPLPNGH